VSSEYDLLKLSELGFFRKGSNFGFVNAFIWMIALGTPMVLVCEELGASPSQVGLISAAVFLLLPDQLAVTTLLPIIGFRRQILSAWGHLFFLLVAPVTVVFLAIIV
jgi:hypothetical protein